MFSKRFNETGKNEDMNTVYCGMSADLIHHGHLNIIHEAMKLGEVTIGVLTDEAIASYKRLPYLTYEQRAEIVAALKCVDEVIPEDDWDMKRDIIERKIDIFCMGSDWEGKFDFLNEVCKVVYFPRTEGISSTELKAEIKEGKGAQDE